MNTKKNIKTVKANKKKSYKKPTYSKKPIYSKKPAYSKNKNDDNTTFPKIEGKLKNIFGISDKLFEKLHIEIHDLYSKSNNKNLVTPAKIHKILLNFFINDYYPIVSRNIKETEKNMAIIMGSVAFNMNVPNKLKFLTIDTDDIDLKIYSTDINYITKKPAKVASVMSVFKYIVIIISMYLKQVISNLIIFSKNFFINNETQKQFGSFINGRVILIVKDRQLIDSFDLLNLSYPETFKLIMDNVNNPDILITNKVNYNIKYNNVIKNNKNSINFSDSKVIYPSLEYPSFYAHYFMNNKKLNFDNYNIEKLTKTDINISNIININYCKNNCHFTAVKSLLLDSCLMLSYAELLNFEDITNNKLLISISSLFKYYKY